MPAPQDNGQTLSNPLFIAPAALPNLGEPSGGAQGTSASASSTGGGSFTFATNVGGQGGTAMASSSSSGGPATATSSSDGNGAQGVAVVSIACSATGADLTVAGLQV